MKKERAADRIVRIVCEWNTECILPRHVMESGNLRHFKATR